jgi:hypothetical protein
MNYKDVSVYNERRLRKTNLRLTTLLYNALVLLEEQYNPFLIIENLGMTQQEYNDIMGVNE